MDDAMGRGDEYWGVINVRARTLLFDACRRARRRYAQLMMSAPINICNGI